MVTSGSRLELGKGLSQGLSVSGFKCNRKQRKRKSPAVLVFSQISGTMTSLLRDLIFSTFKIGNEVDLSGHSKGYVDGQRVILVTLYSLCINSTARLCHLGLLQRGGETP